MSRVLRIILDVIIFLAICFAEYAVHKWTVPFKRGFFCGDESLQYPYHEPTISNVVLIITVLAAPSLVIIAVELFKREQHSETIATSGDKAHSYRLGHRVRKCFAQIGIYLTGLALTLISTDIAKNTIGRLRPHFFAVCEPKFDFGSNCNQAKNFGRYVEEYTCDSSSSSKAMIDDITKSFPSGHASIFFYSMIYTSIYLQASLSTRGSKLLKHLLQFIFILLAWYVALTRVSDYMHHWSDVAAGILLGSIVAVCVALFVAKLIGDSEQSRQLAHVKASHHASSPSTSAKSATPATPVLPAYTFGTLPYLQHPHAAPHPHQYAGQTYHNYGYVP